MYKQSSQAWTMGKSSRAGITSERQTRDLKEVSPDKYELNMSNKKKEPSYSFGGKYPNQTKSLQTPGSGSYQIPSKIIESTGKTMGGKPVAKDKSALLGPGPGGYSVDKQKHNDLKYSFGGKIRDIEKEKQAYKPGPGNYTIETKPNVPSMKFGSGNRTDFTNAKENKSKPGPGNYQGDPTKTIKSAPSYGFGSSVRANTVDNKKKTEPGPGAYVQPTHMGRDGPKRSMGAITNYEPEKREQAYKPGPGAYSADPNSTKKKEPAYRMGSSVRRDLQAEKARAFQADPGLYNPDTNKTKSKSAQYSFGTETRKNAADHAMKNSVPGPNSYGLPSLINKGPKISFGTINEKEGSDKKAYVPGPGTYSLQDLNDPKMKRGPAFTMGSGSRVDLGGGKEAHYKPGPGNYDNSFDQKNKAPKYGFGSSTRASIDKGNKLTVPGPGNYDSKSIIGTEGGQGRTMGSKLYDKTSEKLNKAIPGPGNYDVNLKDKNNAPAYKMGTEKRERHSKSVTPDSGFYDPSTSFTKSKAPGYKIGTEKRGNDPNAKQSAYIPGAGTYNINDSPNKKYQFHMGIKLQDPSKMQTPAPNNYSPDANPQLKKAPGYSMGSKLQSELDINNKEQKPGPGAYTGDSSMKKNGPMYGFGSSQKGVKDSKSKSLTPGPGHYHIPYTVSDVPDYQNARNPDYKYI